MKVCLLYRDRERTNEKTYFDTAGILQDLGLKTLCLAAAKNNVPLEVNLLGYTEGRHYPRKDFWQVAGKAGVKAVFGIDAHRPAAILDADNQIARFKKEYEEFGIKYIDEELI